ncbi:hypothetical protein [Halalkalibacterium halodurans]|uniref:hypothetical protein n=1 Tax=Halalkalibacterium halodurans TaxID=86665 RepID=UPI002E1FD110|nr:hypothetical protein [Halalkalibacterium halodurans]
MTRFVGIDPSTKTGFVALDSDGNVLRAKEITGVGDKDPKRMRTMIVDIVQHIQKGDAISIEGFGYASQQAVQNGGIGWGIRMALEGRSYQYTEVAPNALKKFVNVTGWTGEPGNKKRLSSREKKTAVMRAVADHFGFTHKSDNVVDAYVLAQISRCIALNLSDLEPYQQEVIETILSPKPKNKRKAR